MMADLQALLETIAGLDAQQDLDGLRAARQRLLEDHPQSDAAVEAGYKVGLDLLFRGRKLDEAIVYFDQAARRGHAFWSAAARTSLGICYYHQRRTQKALFELRKVAYSKHVSAHSVTALAFLENIFETSGKRDEAARVRKDRIGQLEQLVAPGQGTLETPAGDRGAYLYQLGLALKDNRDPERAYTVLRQAAGLGAAALGQDLYRSVMDALAYA
jgi:TPR repeat protein